MQDVILVKKIYPTGQKVRKRSTKNLRESTGFSINIPETVNTTDADIAGELEIDSGRDSDCDTRSEFLEVEVDGEKMYTYPTTSIPNDDFGEGHDSNSSHDHDDCEDAELFKEAK